MRPSRPARLSRVVPLAALLVCIVAAPARPEAAKPEKSPAPVPEAAKLKLPEVLGAAAADQLELREFESAAAAPGSVQKIEEALADPERKLAERVAQARRQVSKAERLPDLEELENAWRRERREFDAWRDAVTQRALELQRDIEEIDALRERWEWAGEEARRLQAPAPVIGRVDEMLVAADSTRAKITDVWSRALRVEGRVGESLAGIDELLEDVAEAREKIQQALLAQGPIPIWKAIAVGGSDQPVSEWARENLARILRGGRDFPARNQGRLLLHLALLVAAIVLARVLRPQARRLAADDPSVEPTARALSRPDAAGLLITALATLFIYRDPPRIVMLVAGLLALVAVLRLLPTLVSSSTARVFYALALLFVAERAREVLEGADLIERVLFDVELLVMIAGLSWLASRRGRLDLARSQSGQALVHLLIWLWLGLSVVSFVGSVAGYVELATVIGSATVRSSFGALLFLAGYRVLSGLISIALQTPLALQLNVVRHQRPVITKRLLSLTRLGLSLTWLAMTLDLFTIEAAVFGAIESLFAASFNVGEVEISLGDLGWLTVTLIAAVYLSRLVRFVLEEDVVSRLDLPRGVPQAISVTAGYVVLFVGFLLAIAAAGFDMNRFSLLAGAFGVGLGFGLQNVVNNFVSGLILIFERPVQVGDTIELPGLLGDVKRIGIRSSTVRTFQGAEVIVPNGDLISSQVTNWTLSDKQRRIELAVGVKYGTDPSRVIEILCRIAAEDERILGDPEPTALLVEFGSDSINFQLRAWTQRADMWMAIRSDLSVAVIREFAAAGIEIPFPQRDLHLRSIDPALREPVSRAEPDEPG